MSDSGKISHFACSLVNFFIYENVNDNDFGKVQMLEIYGLKEKAEMKTENINVDPVSIHINNGESKGVDSERFVAL